jgi:phosphoesterase RecJ-like protein
MRTRRHSGRKSPTRGVSVPAPRRRAAAELARILRPGLRVALTTHVNADGDGAGSEVALWHLLTSRGIRAVIANPTPFPDRYAFLLQGNEHADKSGDAVKHFRRADAVIVLDISDVGRLGQLGQLLQESGVPVGCVDHHVSNGALPPGPRLVDAHACATGELVYDLARAVGWGLTPDVARALYVAILTDTGGFRFSNTSARALQVAAHLLAHDLDPEEIYREVYAASPEGRVRLLAEVLETLVVEHAIGLAWVTVPAGALERHGVDAEELEGIVEFPRSIKGMRLALLFRSLASGRIKVSFRSVGDVDVAQLAAQFGGGGHKKAAGASLTGPLAEAQARVLAAARDLLRRR